MKAIHENENITSSKTKKEQIQDQKSLMKSKTLHELLKQGGGQNLVIDFSMLSKRGKLNGLIEKAKKYQDISNQKIIEESDNDKKIENEGKKTNKSKISKNFEILSKFSQRMKKNYDIDNNNLKNNESNNTNEEINKDIINSKIILEKELINDFKKTNVNDNDQEYTDETDNNYEKCLELEYDNNQSDINSQKEIEKNNKSYKSINNSNYNNYYNENIINKKEKKVKFNINGNINYNNNLSNKSNYQYQEQPLLNQNLNNTYNNQKEISKKNTNSNYIRRPFVIEQKTDKNSNNKENTKFLRKSQKQNINSFRNQAIEYETIKENYSIKHCNTVLEYSFREDQNIDSEVSMEDKSKSIENFNNDKNQMVFEIFDGHGGDEMSNYLQMNLAQIYKQNLLLNKGNIILSLKNAFRDADDEMKNQLNIEGLGSTGTLVHIKWESEDDLVVYSANVGDSRVSLISPEHIIRLSYDHRTTDEKERKRILESGLEIIDDRINGTLMLTRIFGNYEYKNDEENEEEENSSNKGLICEPFISKINIDLNIENQFLILASDGIWDTITEEEIQNIIISHNDTQQICSIVIKNCLRNEAWDNMSIFAIKLT